MADATTTRRAMLGAMTLAPFVAAIPVVAMAAPNTIDPAFEALLAKYRAACAEHDRFEASVATPASEARMRATEAWEEACSKISHYTTVPKYEAAGPTGEGGEWLSKTTANSVHLAVAKSAVKGGGFGGDDYMAVCRELVEAEQKREQDKAQLAKQFNLAALQARSVELGKASDRMGDRSHGFLCDVFAHRATSLAIVLKKIDLIEAEDLEPFWDDVTADLRHLAAREA